MKIRPGRTRSLIGGIAALLIMAAGLFMMLGRGGAVGLPGPFVIVWVVFGLLIAGMAFYNAFSRRGLPLYEVDTDREQAGAEGRYCPECGRRVGAEDRFCKYCGARLRE